jgi:predicted GH43/DUF377 family glycosyl hydrolase
MWEKLGLVFKPSGENKSLQSYGSMPLAYHLEGDRYRFYFSSRDSNNSSSVNFVEVNINEPTNILCLSKKPILQKGPYGYFDDNGLYSGCLVKRDGKLYMFYSGRSNGIENLFYMNIGLAVSVDNGLSFDKVRDYPILSRSEYDPWLVTAPSVFDTGNGMSMVYTSGTAIFNDRTSNYDLKLAESDDFFNWKSTGKIVIPLEEGESNISTSSIIKYNNKYHMCFSVKPKVGEYRIGYAYSKDGINWSRNDDLLGLKIGGADFDNKAVSYPSLFIHKDYMYMLYSGSNNGRDGFGIARTKLINFK